MLRKILSRRSKDIHIPMACHQCHITLGHGEKHPDCIAVAEMKELIPTIAFVLKGRAYLRKPRSLSWNLGKFFSFKRVRRIGLDFFRSLIRHYRKGAFDSVDFAKVFRPLVEGLDRLSRLLCKEAEFKKAFGLL